MTQYSLIYLYSYYGIVVKRLFRGLVYVQEKVNDNYPEVFLSQ